MYLDCSDLVAVPLVILTLIFVYCSCIISGLILGFKTLTISEEAYRELVRLKEKGESFTDTILKLTHGRGNILRHAGGWKDMTDEEAREFEEVLKQMWSKWKQKASA